MLSTPAPITVVRTLAGGSGAFGGFWTPFGGGLYVKAYDHTIFETTNGVSIGATYGTNGVVLTALRATNSDFVLWKGSFNADRSLWSSPSNWAGAVIPTTGSRIRLSEYFYPASLGFPPPQPQTPLHPTRATEWAGALPNAGRQKKHGRGH